MMRFIGFLLYFVLILNVAFISAFPHAQTTLTPATIGSSYDPKFDSIDVDEILSQERLLKNYVNCLEGIGPCTPDGKMLKDTLPDAIATNCSKCTETQKSKSDKVTRYLIDNRPEDWDRLEKLYDPEGKYKKEYLEEKSKTEEAKKSEN